MRATVLIARREYLSYVATWGFWISVALTPVFLSIGVVLPAILDRAQSIQHYVAISEDPALIAALDQDAQARQITRTRTGLLRLARQAGQADLEDQVRAALEGEGPAADRIDRARALVGATPQMLDAASGPEDRFVRLDAPGGARTPDALRPYLLGEAMLEGRDGPASLAAAAFLGRGADGEVTIDYWSSKLANRDLSNRIVRVMRTQMRTEALVARNIDLDTINEIDARRPAVSEFTPDRAQDADARVTLADRLPYAIGFGASLGLWLMVFSVVNTLLTSVIEEKATKVLDSLNASARLTEILAGKLLGVAAVSATLLAAWALVAGSAVIIGVVAGAGAGAGGQEARGLQVLSALADPLVLLPFIIYFVFGYLMYGAIFLAIGSLCETLQEAQTLMTPMMLIMMAPLIGVITAARDPDASIVGVMSWLPIYTPFLMMARLPTQPPVWEIVATTLLVIATTFAILWTAGGVFRAGVLGGANMDTVRRGVSGLLTRPFSRS